MRLTSLGKPFTIIGDMNGRVGVESEFQSVDKHEGKNDPSAFITSRSITESPRRNCDQKEPDMIGKKILTLCKSYDMQIGNGRTKGDFMGTYTHHNKNKGQSTVDLALISDSLFPIISDFQVLPQPIFSDHCKIVLTISNLRPMDKVQTNYKWREGTIGYKWSEDSPEKLTKALESDTIKRLVEQCKTQLARKEVNPAGTLIQKIFTSAADVALEKKKQNAVRPKNKKKWKKPTKKWFDEECSNIKKKTNSLANQKHAHPNNVEIREEHRESLKKFRSTCRLKKNKFWKDEAKKLENVQDNNIEFWNKWKNIGEEWHTQEQFPSDIDGQKWEDYYKGLFTEEKGDIDKVLRKEPKPINQKLNTRITKEEMIRIISKLRKGKAVGNDKIANEFLQVMPDNIYNLVLEYLNLTLELGKVCTNWCIGIISLIHKDGPKEDPSNYRAICIMNALLKVLCTLLNERLTDYCEETKLIDVAQIGFKTKSRTTDHIFTLKGTVNKYVVDQNGKKLYACFVDFQKAFDSVWHEGLFRKLENLGINGNFLNLIRDIYKQTKCAVKINNKTTQFFDYNKGVLQGNPLSPTLFNIFINEIFKAVRNRDSMLTLDDTNFFNALMYADDLILLSTTEGGLQSSLNALHEFCRTWKLNINYKKTKRMTFSKGYIRNQPKFYVNNILLENTKTFKYLGITISSAKCSFVPTLEDLSTKATKGLYALRSKLPFTSLPIKTLLKVFDACIQPILLYGSEVWGAYTNMDWKKWDESKIERTHTQFLKRLLGVNRSTTNLMTRAELGRHSLQELVTRRYVRYISYLGGKDTEFLCKQAYDYELKQAHKDNPRPNIFNMLTAVQEIPLQDICVLADKDLKGRIRDKFDADWNTNIQTFKKADTYRLFKDKVSFEPYLEDISCRKYRVSMSKFRLSDHCLMIEKGRHRRPQIPRDQRFCPFCPNHVEDETHFLTQCCGYDHQELQYNIINMAPNFVNLTPQAQLVYLMTQNNNFLTYKLALTINQRLNERKQFEEDLK